MITDEKYDTRKKRLKQIMARQSFFVAVMLSIRMHGAWDVSSDFRYL